METHQEDIREYFEWMREQEWQHYVEQMEEEYHKKYGYSITFMLQWYRFKLKNGIE